MDRLPLAANVRNRACEAAGRHIESIDTMSETMVPPENNGTELNSGPPKSNSVRWLVGLLAVLVVGVGVAWGAGLLEPVANYLSPTLVEVRGKVTFNGQPLSRGLVMTVYETPGLMGGLGPIESDGTFNLTTNGDPGIYSGNHRFKVSYMTSRFPPTSLLPEQYSDVQTTPFAFTIKRGQTGQFLELNMTGELKPDESPSKKPAPSTETSIPAQSPTDSSPSETPEIQN